MYGLTKAFINNTIKVDFKIPFLLFENNAIRVINNTAELLINIPLNGIESACKIPPKADSLKAQSAVILRTEIPVFNS